MATARSYEKVVGQIAHIAGDRPGAARYDSSMTDQARNGADNLLFLCPNHHAEIDAQPDTFPTATLLQWKRDHQERVHRAVAREMANITFEELSLICNAIASEDAPEFSTSYDLTEIQAKIEKNDLMDVAPDIKLSVSKSSVVQKFIEAQSRLDALYEERLRNGFKQKYLALATSGMEPSDIYVDLVAWAQRHTEHGLSTPALAVVSALFESCDIFKT